MRGASGTPRVSNNTLGVGSARQPAGLFKKIQVSNGLTHGKHGLVRIKRSLKQDIEQLCCALRRNFTSLLQCLQTLLMVRMQSGDAGLHANKR